MTKRNQLLLFSTGLLTAGLLVAKLFEDYLQQMPGLRLYTMLIPFTGSSLYPTETDGVVTGFIYGPISTILYLPVLIFKSQKLAVLCSGVLTFAATLVPFYLALRPNEVREEKTLRWWLFLIGALVCLNHPNFGMSYSAHVDAVAMMLMGSAIVLAFRWRESVSIRQSVGLSLLIVLAVWTKQILAPLVLVVPAYFYFQKSRGRARFFMILVVTGLAVSGLFLAVYGKGLYLNMFKIPSSQPWKASYATGGIGPPNLKVFFGALFQMLLEAVPFLVLLLGLALMRPSLSKTSQSAASWYFASALVFIPTCVLGTSKALGASVGYMFVPYLWMLAGLVLLIDVLKKKMEERDFPIWAMALVALIVLPSIREAGYTVYSFRSGSNDPNAEIERIVQDERYFCPWFPLAELLLRRRAIDTSMGLSERRLASVSVPLDRVTSRVPPSAEFLVAPRHLKDCSNSGISSFWPEFSIKTSFSSPNFMVCARERGSSASR